MEETVSRRARILEAAIKSSLFGILLVFAIAILQVVVREVVTVVQFLLVDLIIFISVGAGAAAFYRAAYGRDALGVAAAGATSGSLMGLLTAFTYVLIGLQFSDPISVDTLTESAATETLMYVICICPMMFIGAASSAATAWVSNYIPASFLDIEDKPVPAADVEDTDEIPDPEGMIEIEQEAEQNEPGIEEAPAAPPNPTIKLRHAIHLLETGKKAEAQEIMVTLTREEDPKNPLAWLWLATTLHDQPEKKRRCIQKALEFHPTNPVALEMLNNLEKPLLPPVPLPPKEEAPIAVPEAKKQEAQPQEESLGTQISRRFWRRLKIRMIVAAIVIVIFFVCNGLLNLFQ